MGGVDSSDLVELQVTESHLNQKARAGDAGAWEALTRLHQEPIFRYAYLLLGDADDAQDVAQETFVRAFYRLNHFDAERRLRPWLLSIVWRLAHNWQRSAGRYLQAITRFGREPQLGSDHGLERSDADQLWSAVRRLAPAFQQVIFMRFFLELTEDEAAQAAGVPAGTIKSRLHRALQALRDLISSDYPDLKDAVPE